MLRTAALSIFICIAALSPTQATACGADTDCMIGERSYRIRMPDGHDGATPVGVVVYAHGYKGSAAAVMRNSSLGKVVSDLGLALIALKSAGDDWAIPGAPMDMDATGAEELAYVDAVLDDASARFPIDRERLMATGFSAGGMMVWTLICHRSEQFAVFAPIAGTFWAPEPETCDTPSASVIHIHGDADRIVPLEGRPIAETNQGNVHKVLDMYAEYGGYADPVETTIGILDCTRRANGAADILTFCLFEGGHSFRSEFIRQAWEMFVEAGRVSG